MRSPRLIVISTILNWLAFISAAIFQAIWPWGAFRTEINPSFLVFALFCLFLGALFQTIFLVRNIRVTFDSQVVEKAKRDIHRSIGHLIDELDDDERAQLRDWMLSQEDERSVR